MITDGLVRRYLALATLVTVVGSKSPYSSLKIGFISQFSVELVKNGEFLR
jgi:hypothetical protein